MGGKWNGRSARSGFKMRVPRSGLRSEIGTKPGLMANVRMNEEDSRLCRPGTDSSATSIADLSIDFCLLDHGMCVDFWVHDREDSGCEDMFFRAGPGHRVRRD